MHVEIIKTQGFHIDIVGEPNIGIFPASWELNGDMYFHGKGEFEEFKEELGNLFHKYFIEKPEIQSFEERDEEIFREQEEYSN